MVRAIQYPLSPPCALTTAVGSFFPAPIGFTPRSIFILITSFCHLPHWPLMVPLHSPPHHIIQVSVTISRPTGGRSATRGMRDPSSVRLRSILPRPISHLGNVGQCLGCSCPSTGHDLPCGRLGGLSVATDRGNQLQPRATGERLDFL